MTSTETTAAPVITDATEITDEVRAAASRSEQHARALTSKGVDENTALAEAANEVVPFARSLVQLPRRERTRLELVNAYGGNVYRLLRDLGDHLNLSLAYVDRATVEAHVERTLTSTEWAAVSSRFAALDFDDYVGEQGTWRTAWVDRVLDMAGVPGYGYTADGADE